jgi:hypothetical protein
LVFVTFVKLWSKYLREQLKGRRYFAPDFSGFSPWLLSHMNLGRASWLWEFGGVDISLHRGQEAERRETETRYNLQMYVLQLGPTSQSSTSSS